MATVTNTYSVTFTPSLVGRVGRFITSEAFSTIRSSAGNDVGTTFSGASLASSSTTNEYRSLYRGIYLFDTSSVPASATITSATFSPFGAGKVAGLGSPDLVVVSSNPASNSILANGDYATLGSTSFGSISYASFSIGSPNSISLNASGLANITKGGVSKFGTVLSWDFNNSFTGSWASTLSSELNVSSTTPPVPALQINYTVDFPTLSFNNISSLSNVTTITTS